MRRRYKAQPHSLPRWLIIEIVPAPKSLSNCHGLLMPTAGVIVAVAMSQVQRHLGATSQCCGVSRNRGVVTIRALATVNLNCIQCRTQAQRFFNGCP
jgi:hypothetical protein